MNLWKNYCIKDGLKALCLGPHNTDIPCKLTHCTDYTAACTLDLEGTTYVGKLNITKSGIPCRSQCRNPKPGISKIGPFCNIEAGLTEACAIPLCYDLPGPTSYLDLS